MKIAVIVPAVTNKGPVLVAKDIIERLLDRVDQIDLLYFDSILPQFQIKGCLFIKISWFSPGILRKYDIIHSHSLRPDLFTYFFKFVTRAKILTTVHNYVDQELAYSYNKIISILVSRIWKLSWKNKEAVVFLTNHMKNYYGIENFHQCQTSYIYNGRATSKTVHTLDEDLAKVSELRKRYFVCGICAYLTKRKGVDELVQLLNLDSGIVAVIVGDGPEMDTLKALSKSLKVDDRCFFVGYKDNSIEWIKNFDCYVMSSHSEGFPLVILECGLVSTPVLCKRLDLFRELFDDKEVKFYTQNSLNSMRKSLHELKDSRNDYAKELKLVVETKYSVERMAESYYNLYKQLLANK